MDAIYGHSNQVGGYLGRETNITFGNPPQTLLGAGVYATNPAANYTSGFFQSTGAANVAAQINYSGVWIANYNYVDNNSATFNPPGSYSQLNLLPPSSVGGNQAAVEGYYNRTAAGNPGYGIGVLGVNGNTSAQDGMGVYGFYTGTGTTVRSGGYFYADNGIFSNYAYVGDELNNRKITGVGGVSEIIPTENHGRILLTCPESPEYWYQDYGTVELSNGKAHVDLDDILADIIVVDNENPIRVFCTPVNMLEFNGVTIMNQTSKGFDLVELNGGTHSGKVDYQVVVKPKTNYGEGRFAQAPGPVGLKYTPLKARAKNQPDWSRIFRWQPDNVVYGYDLPKPEQQGVKKQNSPR